MKQGDLYRHFKGGIYRYLRIVIPVSDFTGDNLAEAGNAKHADTLESVAIFEKDGVYFSDCAVCMVHYQNTAEPEKIWVRAVDDFFGSKQQASGESIKRFSLLQ